MDTRITFEDLKLLPDDGRRYEIIDGELFVTPSPRVKHQRLSMRLSMLLASHIEQHGGGEVLAAPTDVFFSDVDVVEPDLLLVSDRNRDRVGEELIRGAPDLVVEILSESTRRRDELIKKKLFERNGVSEYWIVDPELEAVKVLRLSKDRLERVAELTRDAGDTLTTPLLPGLEIPLERLFAARRR